MIGLGVVAALPAEARALGVRSARPPALTPLPDGSLLALSGMGMPAAAAAAQTLVAAGCPALLSFGLAGGLDPSLPPGALLLPRAVRSQQGQRYATCDVWRARLLPRLAQLGSVEQGELLSCTRPLAGRADKALAHATSGAVAVDMESASVADVAARHELPFLTLRVVVDAADDELPAAVAAASQGGALQVGRLIAGLLRHPGELGALLRLSARYRVALRALTAAARSGSLRP